MHLRLVSSLIATAVIASGCNREPPGREYVLKGQILGIETARKEVLIRHEDIKGFMPAMTMPFTVQDAELLAGKEPGDLVTATLVVTDVSAHLSALTRTGHAPIETPPPTAEGPRILVPGEPVADAPLVDQAGSPHPFSAFKGHRIAITFIYTRCPLPEFCPLMDRHFAAIQRQLEGTQDLRDVRLVSVTLDPEFDTPAILRDHAQRLKADPNVWTFLTGTPADVAAFSQQFGIFTEKDLGTGANLTHNLRTAVVGIDGRLASVHSGNDWTPADLVADLKATPAPAH